MFRFGSREERRSLKKKASTTSQHGHPKGSSATAGKNSSDLDTFRKLATAIEKELADPEHLSKQQAGLLKETRDTVMSGHFSFVEKIAAMCFMVKSLSHKENSLSHRLLLYINNHHELTVEKHTKDEPDLAIFLASTNWKKHLKNHWTKVIGKMLKANQSKICLTDLPSERRDALTLHSYQRLSAAEFHCTRVRGDYIEFYI